MLLAFATLTVAVFALGDMVGKVDNTAHDQAGPPSERQRRQTRANPGEAVVSWDAVAGASAYRVGWLAVSDYEANRANDQWRERLRLLGRQRQLVLHGDPPDIPAKRITSSRAGNRTAT